MNIDQYNQNELEKSHDIFGLHRHIYPCYDLGDSRDSDKFQQTEDLQRWSLLFRENETYSV